MENRIDTIHAGALAHLARRIEESDIIRHPCLHLEVPNLLPAAYASELTKRIPARTAFTPLRHRDAMNSRGESTRGELRLADGKLDHLDARDRPFWLGVGRMFGDAGLRCLVQRKLGLQADLVALTSLYQDRTGYRIRPHTDIETKAITMQIYLPPDERWRRYGTTFYRREGERFVAEKRISFVPGQGYLFPVTRDSWHGVEEVDDRALVRNSLMVIFYRRKYLTEGGEINFIDPNVDRVRDAHGVETSKPRVITRPDGLCSG